MQLSPLLEGVSPLLEGVSLVLVGLPLLLDGAWCVAWSVLGLPQDLGAGRLSADAELEELSPLPMLASVADCVPVGSGL